MENLLSRMRGKCSTACSNQLKPSNGELLVAVDHNQLRTMASETVDSIDWSYSPPSWAVTLERLVHSVNQCNLRENRHFNERIRGNHIAYAAVAVQELLLVLLLYRSCCCYCCTGVVAAAVAVEKLLLLLLLLYRSSCCCCCRCCCCTCVIVAAAVAVPELSLMLLYRSCCCCFY